MPWRPLPQIAFAVAIYPFEPSWPDDLPLELGDELYIIEQDGVDGAWYRGYLVAPPSLLAGLTSVKGQTLEARVFSGIFPRSCVEVREMLGAGSGSTTGEDEEAGGVDGAQASHHTTKLAGDAPNAVSDSVGNGDTTLLTNGTKAGSTKKLSQIRPASNGPEIPLSRPLSRKFSGRQKEKSLGRGLSLRSAKSQRSQRSQKSLPTSPPPQPDLREPGAPKPPAPVPMLKVGDETPTSEQEPLVDEIASSLREWHSTNLHELLLARQYSALGRLSKFVQKLDFARRQLLHNVLTDWELAVLREKVIWDLVRGNKLLGGEVIVRDPAHRGRILVGGDSAVDLTKLQAMMSLLDEAPVQHQEATTLHHLLISAKSFTGATAETTTFVFYLCAKTPGSPPEQISETFSEELSSHDGLGVDRLERLKTLFVGLTPKDVGEGAAAESSLYLVAKVQSEKLLWARPPPTSNGVPASRDSSTPTKYNGNLASGPPRLTPDAKSGRRSLMWGQKPPSFGRASNLSSSRPGSGHNERRQPTSSDSLKKTYSDRSIATTTSIAGAMPQAIKALVKRTTGVGVVNVGQLIKAEKDADQTIQIFSPVNNKPGPHEEDWEDVISELMTMQHPGQASRFGNAERLNVQLYYFSDEDAESLIRRTPTLLQDVGQTNKIGFSGAPTKPRSDIYITLSQALFPRQALLSHPLSGSTPLGNHLSLTDLQLTLEVRRQSGERVSDCIFPSSNSEGLSSWQTTVVEKGDSWNQVVRLVVSPDIVQTCHIALTLADAPSPPIAISWMPLWDQQAFMRDGEHSLLLYKYDEATAVATSASSEVTGYLSLPWSSKGKDDASKDEAVSGPLATLNVRSYLCSTIFSQDKVLLGLLRWRERRHPELVALLQRVVFVPEIEIVKLLSEVFDALFGILVEQAGSDDYEDLVFSALVTVLSIVHDRRFNLGPLVDRYAETRFNYPFASPCLIRSLTRLLSNPTDQESARKLRATFKVGRLVFKFIINAREQQKAKEAGIGITSTRPSFTRDLQNIFRALEGLMRGSAPTLVGTQTLAVQHIHTWIPELAGYLDTDDILHIAIDFIDSCAAVKGKLILYKLTLIEHLSRLDIFSHTETRRTFIINTVRWLAPHWGDVPAVTDQYRDQVRLCCTVLSTQMVHLEQQASDYIPKIVDSYRAIQAAGIGEKSNFSMLFPRTYPFPSRPITGRRPVFDEVIVELATILAAIWTLPINIQLDHLPEELELSELLVHVLQVHTSILDGKAFPQEWISVNIYHHLSTMKTLEHIGGILIDSFLPHPDDAESFNTDLWLVFFRTLLKLVGSDALALETFPEQKRRAVWKIAGDVREQGAGLLRRSWEAIGWESSSEDRRRYGLEKMGGYQVQYVPGLVGPVVSLCMSVHEGLRSVAVRTLQTMIVSEWTLSQDLSVIQAEMIDCLDDFFKSRALSENVLQKLFIAELMDLFEPLALLPDEPLYRSLKDLIAAIDAYLDLLMAVHATDMPGEASHIMATLKLMEFLRGLQKDDIFIRYVHQLANVQLQARSPAEAGLAIRLHADLYGWDPSKRVPALQEPPLPEQSAFERKESLYFSMIGNFEEGRSWDIALEAYKELAHQYEHNVYDFAKLARTDRAKAKVFEAISRGERQTPRYFRVVFKGFGFPVGLRDKQFIFEAGPSEKLSAFTDRMQQQHPSAQMLLNNETEDLEGQFLQISAVSPYRDLYHPVHQRAKISPPIREHLLFARPRHFSATTRRSPSGLPVGEQWVEKTLYSTAEPFPTILRRSEITAVEEIRLSPLQSAIERTIRKTHELSTMEQRIIDGNESSFPSLIEALNMSIDQTSDSSIARYHDLLPNEPDGHEEGSGEGEDEEAAEEKVEPEMEKDPLQVALATALLDHAMVAKRCLGMYSRLGGTEAAYHLTRDFEKSFSRELASLASTARQSQSVAQSPQQPLSPTRFSHENGVPFDLSEKPPVFDKDSIKGDTEPQSPRVERSRISLNFRRRGTLDENAETKTNGHHQPTIVEESGQGRQSRRSRSRSRSKSINRRSFLGGFERDKSKSRSGSSPARRRSGSSHRPQTSGSNFESLSSSMGSVKKRFSMLKLGKKNSKISVKVDSVKEE
ncbi:MAG: hypothetical protein M1825_001083 [Sarcosagium campestre]|nr:MAG: hypothetical protein M1825_001083 [Sarcosagium campestre]